VSADLLRIKITGQGPVALSLWLFARRAGVPAESFELDPPPSLALTAPPSLARRTLALSLGSWQLLSRIIELPRASPIHEVEVSLQGHAGRTRITSAEMQVAALGYVTDYHSLQQSLINAAASLIRATSAAGPALAQTVAVQVHAEGSAGDEADVRDFSQHAVLANLHCPEQRSHCALERFTVDGPVALLPLADSGEFSLVWCCPPQEAIRRVQIDEAQFLRELRKQLGAPLGHARLSSVRSESPLQRRQRRHSQRGLQVWIGNAAQALHPVAGQGLNLGLRDSFELAQQLATLSLRSPLPEASEIERSLRNFIAAREPDRRQTVRITDTLASVFTRTWMSPAQSLALALLDLTPALRHGFAGRLMYGKRG
jgi:2-octaprenyl-6-methoxyphenol hydroxylase